MEQTLERIGRIQLIDDTPKFCVVCAQPLVSENVFAGYNIFTGVVTVRRVWVCPNSRTSERILAGRFGWAFASCQRWTDYQVTGGWAAAIALLSPEEAEARSDVSMTDLDGTEPERRPLIPWFREDPQWPDNHPPVRVMTDGSPCWCVSDDAPHEGWVHAPVCLAKRGQMGLNDDAAPGTVPEVPNA